MDLSRYTSKINELLKRTDERIKDLRTDPDLSREAKIRQISEAQQGLRAEYARLRADAENNLVVDIKMASRRANPPEQISGDNQAQIARELRRARIRDDLKATWEGRGGGPTLEEYRTAIVAGDTLVIEVLETYGPAAIANEGMRQQFVAAVEESRRNRMTDDQRAALAELETLEKARLELGVVLNFKDSEARRLSDTPAGQLADSSTAA